MATKQILMMTTSANQLNMSDIPKPKRFMVLEACPDGTTTRYIIRADKDNWKKYDASMMEWKDVATQSPTASSVMAEGNTAEELNAIPEKSMKSFIGKTLNVAAALQTQDPDGIILPEISTFAIVGGAAQQNTRHFSNHAILSVHTIKELNKYKNSNITYYNEHLTISLPAIGIALMKSGGGIGTWKQIDMEGDLV